MKLAFSSKFILKVSIVSLVLVMFSFVAPKISEIFIQTTSATQSPKTGQIVNYPEAGSEKIDQILAREIDAWKQEFNENASQNQGQEINYHISYQQQQILSIQLENRVFQENNLKAVKRAYKTFDLNTQAELKASDLFKNSAGFEQTFLRDIELQIQENPKFQNRSINGVEALAHINADAMQDFAINQDYIWVLVKIGSAENPQDYLQIPLNLPLKNFFYAIKPEILSRIVSAEVLASDPKRQPNFCQEHACIALTFDDGPSVHTERLLDILRRNNALATFFVLGENAHGKEFILRRQINEGHVLGNHSWRHPNLSKADAGKIAYEIDQTNHLIERATGQMPTLFRPPYGAYNQTVINQLRQRGQSLIMWSVDPKDWLLREPNAIADHIEAHAQAGSIIVMHDTHASSVDAVELIIQKLRQKGMVLVDVNTLFGGSTTPGYAYSKR